MMTKNNDFQQAMRQRYHGFDTKLKLCMIQRCMFTQWSNQLKKIGYGWWCLEVHSKIDKLGFQSPSLAAVKKLSEKSPNFTIMESSG